MFHENDESLICVHHTAHSSKLDALSRPLRLSFTFLVSYLLPTKTTILNIYRSHSLFLLSASHDIILMHKNFLENCKSGKM